MNLRGKTVWITGASSGIGEALAHQLNAMDCFVILSARSVEKLQMVQAALPNPEKASILNFDLGDLQACADAIQSLKDLNQMPDVLINNGGVSQRALAEETSFEVDEQIMRVNYFSAVVLSKGVLAHMKQYGGCIVAVSSIAGRFGFPLRSAYSAAKHALVGFFETLSLELDQSKVQVNIVFPGRVQTSISNYALKGDGNLHAESDKGQAEGITAQACADDIIKGIASNKQWIYSGSKELWMWKIYKFFPKLFRKLALKVSAK